MRTLTSILLLTFGVSSVGVWAHHSVHVNFDQSREITVEGVLTEIKWINPHSRFRMDVTSVDGTTMEWLVEMGALNTMKRRGFNMHVFSPGDTVRVIGWPGRRERAVHLNQAFVWDGGEEVCVGARCVRKKVGSGTNKTGVRYK